MLTRHRDGGILRMPMFFFAQVPAVQTTATARVERCAPLALSDYASPKRAAG